MLDAGSAASCPAIAWSRYAQSSTVRAIGPVWSSVQESVITPARLTRPYVGFSPVMPQKAAGPRMEPPVSEPVAPCSNPAASAAPEPLDEPPGMCSRFHGLRAGWKRWPGNWRPKANSWVMSLPRSTVPASCQRRPTVESLSGTQSAKSAEPPVVRIPFVR